MGTTVREVDGATRFNLRNGTYIFNTLIFSSSKFVTNLLLACIDDALESLYLSHVVVVLVDLALVLIRLPSCQDLLILVFYALVVACCRL